MNCMNCKYINECRWRAMVHFLFLCLPLAGGTCTRLQIIDKIISSICVFYKHKGR